MSQAFIASPLGTLEIIGDTHGISRVTFIDILKEIALILILN